MKLWVMPCRATQDRQVMVESFDRMWSTGEGNGKPLQYSCLENPMNSMKRQKDRTMKGKLERSVGAQYAAGDQWRNNSRKNVEMEPKQKQYSVVDVIGDGSKIQCCKEQYCIGTWNVRSMNQKNWSSQTRDGKSERWHFRNQWTKWNGMDEFNSDDHHIYYCGQESLRRNGVAITVKSKKQTKKKTLWNAVLGFNLENDRMISVRFQGKPFNIIVIQLYAPTSNAKEAEVEWFYKDLQDLLEITPPKRYPFHHKGPECKRRKSRNPWSNRQIWPWSTKWSRAKANRVLPREHTGHSKHPLPTTQEKTLHMNITRWSTLKSDWLSSLQPKMEKLYTVSKNKTGSWLWLRSWTPYCQIQN